MIDEKDYLFLARELMLLILELQAEIGVLRMAVQTQGVSLEQLAELRAQVERLVHFQEARERIQAAGFESLLQFLKDFEGPIQ